MELQEWYNHTMRKADPRVADWLLMDCPVVTYTLVLLYLVMVWAGPRLMRHRAAFDLKPLLIVYNAALVVLSAYMFWEFFATSVLQPGFSMTCQPVDFSDSPHALRLARVCWWFFFSKLIEFIDTLFFILRKKNRQISFLHVYHHSTMPALWWIGVKFIPGGETYFSAMINSGIHVLMYSYYALSACGPAFQKYLWWKKYMTSLQLLQFLSILAHTAIAMYVDCDFPVGFGYALLAYATSHVLLFSHFYHQSYVKKPAQSATPRQNGDASHGSMRNGTVKDGVVTNGSTLKKRH